MSSDIWVGLSFRHTSLIIDPQPSASTIFHPPRLTLSCQMFFLWFFPPLPCLQFVKKCFFLQSVTLCHFPSTIFKTNLNQPCSIQWPLLWTTISLEDIFSAKNEFAKKCSLASKGKTSQTNFFFYIFKEGRRGGGVKHMFKNLCCRFCIILQAIWQYQLT